MRHICIEATDLGDAWFQALYQILTGGRKYLITKGSFEGTHRIGSPTTIIIEVPGSKPLFPIMPEGSNLPPPTTEQDINDYSTYLMTDKKADNEHYTYGEDLAWQIEDVIKRFKKEGDGNNHCYMTVGRPETLYHYEKGIEYDEVITIRDVITGKTEERTRTNSWNKDPKNKPSSQCLRGIDTWIDEDGLHFWCYFRSWDLWGGFPVNLGGIQLAKEYMAGEIGVADGGMIVSCKDLHVYEHAFEVAAQRIGKTKEELMRFFSKSL